MDVTFTAAELRYLAGQRLGEPVRDLLIAYFRGFDRRRSDEAWLRTLFADDAEVDFPIASAIGPAEIARQTRRALELWGRTLHHLGSETVTVEGTRATLTATLHATHLHREDDPGRPLHVGADIDAEAILTSSGWRLRTLALDLVWTEGDGPTPPTSTE